MKTATVTIESMPGSPLAQSRYIDEKKGEKETADDFEKRSWPKKVHSLPDGTVYIPAMGLKQAMVSACKHLGLQVPGRGKKTYTASFEGGVMLAGDIKTNRKANEAEGKVLLMNADGVRGSGKRVKRIIPHFDSWVGTFEAVILDDIITEEVFERVLLEAGRFKGLGQFRPEKGGINGRFSVKSIKWA